MCDSVHRVGGGAGRGAIPACIAGGIPACLSLGGSAPGEDLLPGGLLPGGCLVETPPGTATAAGGTHPTGRHSCGN